MAESDSDLSTPPATDDEMPVAVAAPATKNPRAETKKPKKKKKPNGTILSFFDRDDASPPRKNRAPSPPHESVPEDSFDVAFIVMFRSRFADAFPPRCPHMGPQDIERGVAEEVPSSQVENLLCALLGLVLNRKKPVEKGHYGRALEEALQTQKSQWPQAWKSVNPLHGGRSFNSMVPSERIALLKTLVLWSLNQSELINNMIKDGYKTRSSKDRADANIPLSVQPWGRDGDKRRYWLIEGQDDTNFRVYREGNPGLKSATWWSMAGSIDEIRVLAKKLEDDDGTREAKSLSERMLHAIPRFEATEEKRKRREYRLARKAAFTRPEPGFSMYEGRTRGKRMRYTYSDEEDYGSDDMSNRRSMRNSGRETPAEPMGPTVTASGRQVRSRATGAYGESLLSGQMTEGASPATGDYVRSEGSEEPERPAHGRATRGAEHAENGWNKSRKLIDTYNSVDEMDEDEDDATSWDGGDEDDEEPEQMNLGGDDDEEVSDEQPTDEEEDPSSLVVRLRYPKGSFSSPAPDAETKHEHGSPPLVKQQKDDGMRPSSATTLDTNGPRLPPFAVEPNRKLMMIPTPEHPQREDEVDATRIEALPKPQTAHHTVKEYISTSESQFASTLPPHQRPQQQTASYTPALANGHAHAHAITATSAAASPPPPPGPKDVEQRPLPVGVPAGMGVPTSTSAGGWQ